MWFMGIMIILTLYMLYQSINKFKNSKPRTGERFSSVYLIAVFGFLLVMFIWITLGAPGYTPNERHRTSSVDQTQSIFQTHLHDRHHHTVL